MPAPKVVPIFETETVGRIDILIMRIAERATRLVETKLAERGFRVNWWDGADGVRALVEDALSDYRVPRESIFTPRAVARRVGFIGKRRRAG